MVTANSTGTAKATILVVDDSAENIDILYNLLKDKYEIKVAISGEKALEAARTGSIPDLILLDIIMPEMDGFSVCEKLKSSFLTKNIPIIFVTAQSEEFNEEKGFSLGAVDYINKPIRPSVLLARVKTHLVLNNQKNHLEILINEKTQKLLKTQLKIFHTLAKAGEFKDKATGAHVIRMSKYCQLIGKAFGMSDEEADLLQTVVTMHDIGKIGIPDNILLKHGKLDAEEWAVLKTHTLIGAEIIGEDNSDIFRYARICILTHHEKWDGSGYPYGLKGEDIHLYGRIAAIADVFDALTSKRPYKKAWSENDALALIKRERGKYFDPALVDVFVEIFPEILVIKEQYKDTSKSVYYE